MMEGGEQSMKQKLNLTPALGVGLLGGNVLRWWVALPGWYSLPSVVDIHATVEGIAVLLAEVVAYPYSRRIDTLSKEASVTTEGRIAALNKEAGDARKRAGEAESTGKQLGVELELEKQKTARFQKEADVARLTLETNVRKMSPRYALVYEGRDQIISAANPFMGQKTEIQTCGRHQFDEIALFVQSLADTLARAKWDIKRTEAGCSGYGRTGVSVAVNTESSESTITAAKSLAIVLEKLLWGDFDKKEFDAIVKIRESPDFRQGPWAWLAPVFPENPPLAVGILRVQVVARQP
jgi:hypothetical protein